MVARCVVCGGCVKGAWIMCRGVQRAHGGGVEGVKRVCRGCAEWLLGAQSGTWTGFKVHRGCLVGIQMGA